MSGINRFKSVACAVVSAIKHYRPALVGTGMAAWFGAAFIPGEPFEMTKPVEPVKLGSVEDYKLRVVVYPSDVKSGSVGHAAVQVGTNESPSEFHFSYWPDNVAQAGFSVLAGGILNKGACYSMAEDLKAENREPEVYEIAATPEQLAKAIAVIQELKNMNESGQLTYSMIFHNSKGAELQRYIRENCPLISSTLQIPKGQQTLNCVDGVKAVLKEAGIDYSDEFFSEIMKAVTPAGFSEAFAKAADHDAYPFVSVFKGRILLDPSINNARDDELNDTCDPF